MHAAKAMQLALVANDSTTFITSEVRVLQMTAGLMFL
jgi:hypothetical protein